MNVLKILSKFIMMIINIIKHGPDFAVQVHVESEPFLGVRRLSLTAAAAAGACRLSRPARGEGGSSILCNLNLQSLLPNESQEENHRSKNALHLHHLQVKRSGPGLFHGFSVSLY